MRSATLGRDDARRKLSQRSLVRSLLAGAVKTCLSEYWTPLAVAKRAADWLEDLGIRTVVDIGSGAGKFCVVGALFGKCRFIGLEQYSSLVTSAVALVDLFDLNDRVSFVAGALGAVPTPVGDAYTFQPVR